MWKVQFMANVYFNIKLEMLCLYLIDQNCLHQVLTISKQWNPQIWFCLFTFQLIVWKQLNSSTKIYSQLIRWSVVQWQRIGFGCKRSPFQFPALARVYTFVCLIFLFCCCCVLTFCPKAHYLSQNVAIPFAMLIFSILNILYDYNGIKIQK